MSKYPHIRVAKEHADLIEDLRKAWGCRSRTETTRILTRKIKNGEPIFNGERKDKFKLNI